MPESDITKLSNILVEMQIAQAKMQADISYTRQTIDKMQEENDARDKHIHSLEISKREARAVSAFIGACVGILIPLLWQSFFR